MRLFFSIFILLVSGCSISPSDLRLSHLEIIEADAHPELIYNNYDHIDHRRYEEGIVSFQNKNIHLDDYQALIDSVYINNRTKNNRPIFEVTFNSEVNLMNDYISQGYTMGVDAYYCSGLSRKPQLAAYGSVFMRKVDLSETVIISELMTPYAKKYQYQIYLRVKGNGFDLEKKPQDVCFVLNGGRMWRNAYESNTVVIPQDKIEKAIRDGLK
jgi:hypothetical protein